MRFLYREADDDDEGAEDPNTNDSLLQDLALESVRFLYDEPGDDETNAGEDDYDCDCDDENEDEYEVDSVASNPFPFKQDYCNNRSYTSPVLDLEDDSQWRYYGYSDKEDDDGSSSTTSDSSDSDDGGILRYGPSEYDTDLTTEQMNEEAEIFTREQLLLMAREVRCESAVKDEDEEEEDEADSSSNSASPVQKSAPQAPLVEAEPLHESVIHPSDSSQNFYASEPETDNDSEGEQSKHEIETAPTLLLHTPTTTNNTNNNNPNIDTMSSTDGSPTRTVPPVPQFSRSTVGGSKAQPTAHPNPFEVDDLIFESRFESGNLGRAIKITPTYYELYLRPDMYTNRHTQWFYFRVKNTKAKVVYR